MPHETDCAARRAIDALAEYFSKLDVANVPEGFGERRPPGKWPAPEAIHFHRVRCLYGYENTPGDAGAAETARARKEAINAGKGVRGLKDKILNDVLPAVVAEAAMSGAAKHVRDAATAWVREGFDLVFPYPRPWQDVVQESDFAEYRTKFEPIRADLLALAAGASAVGTKTGKPADDGTRRGRLTKAKSEAKQASMLATLRRHPSMKDDLAKLATVIGVSESTVRRWLNAEEDKYLVSRPANADPDEARPDEE